MATPSTQRGHTKSPGPSYSTTRNIPPTTLTIADLQTVPGLLRKRGYKEVDIDAIMYANWIGFFKRAWTKSP